MARPDFDVNVGIGGDQTGLRVIPLGRPLPLIHTLGEGQRIALQSTVGEKAVPVVVHDPTGIIKRGNRNVRVLESK